MKKSKKLTDADLIARYRSGDKSVMSALVKRWHVQFCKLAFWMVKDADIAKDIAQESWIAIINNLDNLNEPEKYKSWAISIVNRKAIDWIRANKREESKLKKAFQEGVVLDNSEKEDERLNLKIQLYKAIVELPISQQMVIKMFYLESYSLKQISKTLDITIGTAKSRLFYAREKLKLIVKNRNYE